MGVPGDYRPTKSPVQRFRTGGHHLQTLVRTGLGSTLRTPHEYWSGILNDMHLNPQRLTRREKLILAGLYLSKYDALGLKRLRLGSFLEAFNVLGYALCSRPPSVTN